MSNRQERRRIMKQQTPQNIERAIKGALAEQKRDFDKRLQYEKDLVIDIVLTMMAYTIQYKLSLGKKRLPQIVEAIMDNIDAFNTGHLSPEDYKEIKEMLKNKYGVVVNEGSK